MCVIVIQCPTIGECGRRSVQAQLQAPANRSLSQAPAHLSLWQHVPLIEHFGHYRWDCFPVACLVLLRHGDDRVIALAVTNTREWEVDVHEWTSWLKLFIILHLVLFPKNQYVRIWPPWEQLEAHAIIQDQDLQRMVGASIHLVALTQRFLLPELKLVLAFQPLTAAR